MDDGVLWRHVELYVTDRTEDLGAEGARALGELARVARAAGLLPREAATLEVFAGGAGAGAAAGQAP
jgi:predicted solute-binding protein